VNDPEDVLAAFKMYHTTAELSSTTPARLQDAQVELVLVM
jgi:hypothetical protein